MSHTLDKLKGKKIAVIGGSSGIGFGAAHLLLQAGAHVTILSSTTTKLDSATSRLNALGFTSPQLSSALIDVRDETAATATLRDLAPLDHIVFSSVDLIIRGALADADLNDAKTLFGVKFWGSVVVGKALVKYDIVRPGGSLTLTSGTAALRPGRGAAIGGALNGGILSLTKGLASELADKRIRVNTVVPGLVKTELWDKLGRTKEQQEEQMAKAAGELSVGFVAGPEEIAEAYLYAVRANYANGTLIMIDGGNQL